MSPVEYLIHQPRYENQAFDSETPGYDKLTPATRKKGRENGGASLPCLFDSLIRETDLRCESRRGESPTPRVTTA